ncbi:hypothetical protein N5P37_010537 [Trichoderma harzianum]|nr:hypothetical protein N5P37_010537 [Trichoderma harzianum]
MPGSSAHIAPKVANSSLEAGATTSPARLADDHDPSYSINRFLSEPNYTLGYGPAQSPAEAEKRAFEQLRKFETKFSSNSDASQRH